MNAIRSYDTSRPLLHGVHLAPDGRLTATDGKVLLTWGWAVSYAAGAVPTEGLILEITPAVVKLAKMRRCSLLSLDIDIESAVVKWTPFMQQYRSVPSVLSRVLDGPYPNYRQVIPKCTPDAVVPMPTFSAEMLAKFAAVTPLAGVTLTPSAPGSAVCVTFPGNPDAFGLIMPSQTECGERTIPAWVLSPGK